MVFSEEGSVATMNKRSKYKICKLNNFFNPLHSSVVKEVPLTKILISKKNGSFEKKTPMNAVFPCS